MRKLSVALVAVGVLAVAGGATAAGKYVITSIHQIKPSVVAHLRGSAGRPGLAGPRGLPGATGPQGSAGLASVKTVVGPATEATECTPTVCSDSSIVAATAQCPAGSVAVSGGWVGDPNNPPAIPFLLASAPNGSTGWTVLLANAEDHTVGIEALVTCALAPIGAAADAHTARAPAGWVKAELAAARRVVAKRAAALKSAGH